MTIWQNIAVLIYGMYALASLYYGYQMSINQRNPNRNPDGWCPAFYLLGAFVWADALVLGLFWIFISATVLLLNDWLLILLIISVFWVIRGVGETTYWIGQQFSTVNRHPIENLPWFSEFGNDSVWFVYQVIAQCVTVVAIICSIYFGKLWLETI